MPGMVIESGWPRTNNHRFMNFISSDCERLMRAPRVRISRILRMGLDQRGHLDGLRMMHDHALHELDVCVRILRNDAGGGRRERPAGSAGCAGLDHWRCV
jgi:hypothetical protein